MVFGGKKKSSSLWLSSCAKCFQKPSSSGIDPEDKHSNALSDSDSFKNKPGGWRAVSFILGNETFERLATIGLLANFMVYLTRELHMTQVDASNVMNIWSGTTNFAPLVGAYISDTYVGRFRTIGFASFASLLGMLIVTLTSGLPQLHPPSCKLGVLPSGQCTSPNSLQLGVLLMGLGFLSIGTGGIRPCSIPFGVDQFDQSTEEGAKGVNSFFNWYYTTFTVVILISLTVVVYIQDTVSWVWGFSIPTVLMGCSIILFFVGAKTYVHVKPEGSIFSGVARVLVAAYKKRKIELLTDQEENFDGVFYDPPLKKESSISKIPFTNQYRFLNKAAMITENDLKPDGSPVNQWRLCTIQQVEEVKCLIKIIPIWSAGLISFTAMTQQGTFTVSQAMNMNRHLGPKFQIPAGSISIISMITIGIFLPLYDRILVPTLRKITKHEGGITLLQRIGIGIVFSILAMIVAGLVEKERRAVANKHRGVGTTSVMWLAPQLILMGFYEAFNIIGQIEFFNRQFPEHMRSIANSLLFCSMAGASYLSSLIVNIVHGVTGDKNHPDWLTNDLNAGKLDYFYYLVAGLGVFNFIYFVYLARRYRYKVTVPIGDKTRFDDVELSSSTKV